MTKKTVKAFSKDDCWIGRPFYMLSQYTSFANILCDQSSAQIWAACDKNGVRPSEVASTVRVAVKDVFKPIAKLVAVGAFERSCPDKVQALMRLAKVWCSDLILAAQFSEVMEDPLKRESFRNHA